MCYVSRKSALGGTKVLREWMNRCTDDAQCELNNMFYFLKSFCWTEVHFVGQLVPSFSELG